MIFVLLLGNGVFALAEIAVVSSRKARLRAEADAGSSRARAALALAEQPDRFLSTVQIGITLVGILAGAFGGASLTSRLAGVFDDFPVLAPYSRPLALALVVGAITYFSLIIGELVPKRIALSNPEKRAMLVSKPMMWLARAASPVVWLLSKSTHLVVRLLGLGNEKEAPPSDEEVAQLVRQGTTAGVFHRAEVRMVEGVLHLDERRVTELMTRRADIVWLNAADPDATNWSKIVASGHSHFPVFEGNRDNVLGLVSVKALWADTVAGQAPRLRDHLRQPLFVPETITAIELVEAFRRSGQHFALVTDEFGSIQGVVTLIDVTEAIVGDLPEPGDRPEPSAVQREDGSWLMSGAMPVSDVRRHIGVDIADPVNRHFETLGGFVLHTLGHIPKTGEVVERFGWRFEVVDMDRHRIDKLLVSPPPENHPDRARPGG